MSIAFLAEKSLSKVTKNDLHEIATNFNIKIPDGPESDAYLLLLQSMETILQHIKDSPDYIHPSLVPVSTTMPRSYWLPANKENPLNAWLYRCDIVASNPSSTLLQGRTVAFKDNISVGGLPTTLGTFPELFWGSTDGKLPVSCIDASVVARLLEAGATIKGSSICENFAASPLSYSAATGPVHSPWIHGYSSGGSSSGSAALVAANIVHRQTNQSFDQIVDLAIGSDQAGSIRIPASYLGIYGLKPTFSLIPYTGAVSLAPMIDHLGPLAEKLEDIAILLQVMAGYDGIDSRMSPESPLKKDVLDYPQLLAQFKSQSRGRYIAGEEKLGSGFKVAILLESFETPGCAPEIRDHVMQSAKIYFEMAGASVSEISIPMHREGILVWTAATRMSVSEYACQGKPSGLLSYLPPHIRTQWPPDQRMYDLLSANIPPLINIIFSGPFLNKQFGPITEAKAHRKVFELRAAYDYALEDFDVLITPCTPNVAMPHPEMNSIASSVMEKVNVAMG